MYFFRSASLTFSGQANFPTGYRGSILSSFRTRARACPGLLFDHKQFEAPDWISKSTYRPGQSPPLHFGQTSFACKLIFVAARALDTGQPFFAASASSWNL